MYHTVASFRFSGEAIRRRILASVTDLEALKAASRHPQRFRLGDDSTRPDMFKARQHATSQRLAEVRPSDPWVREIVDKWCEISRLPSSEAQFWAEAGFKAALKDGRDIHLQAYLDEDGWAWVSTRDSPNHWLHRKRLPETVRQEFARLLQRKRP
jgi:hypothetical protein